MSAREAGAKTAMAKASVVNGLGEPEEAVLERALRGAPDDSDAEEAPQQQQQEDLMDAEELEVVSHALGVDKLRQETRSHAETGVALDVADELGRMQPYILEQASQRSEKLRSELGAFVQHLKRSSPATLPHDSNNRSQHLASSTRNDATSTIHADGVDNVDNASEEHNEQCSPSRCTPNTMNRIAELDEQLQQVTECERDVRAQMYPDHFVDDPQKLITESNFAKCLREQRRERKLRKALHSESAMKQGKRIAANASKTATHEQAHASKLSGAEEALVERLLDAEEDELERNNPFEGDIELDSAGMTGEAECSGAETSTSENGSSSASARSRTAIERLKEIDEGLLELGSPVDEISSSRPTTAHGTPGEGEAVTKNAEEQCSESEAENAEENEDKLSNASSTWNHPSSSRRKKERTSFPGEIDVNDNQRSDILRQQCEVWQLHQAEEDIDRKLRELKTCAPPEKLAEDDMKSLVDECSRDQMKRGEVAAKYRGELSLIGDEARRESDSNGGVAES